MSERDEGVRPSADLVSDVRMKLGKYRTAIDREAMLFEEIVGDFQSLRAHVTYLAGRTRADALRLAAEVLESESHDVVMPPADDEGLAHREEVADRLLLAAKRLRALADEEER